MHYLAVSVHVGSSVLQCTNCTVCFSRSLWLRLAPPVGAAIVYISSGCLLLTAEAQIAQYVLAAVPLHRRRFSSRTTSVWSRSRIEKEGLTKRAIILCEFNKSLLEISISVGIYYGNTGCGVFKRGVQN